MWLNAITLLLAYPKYARSESLNPGCVNPELHEASQTSSSISSQYNETSRGRPTTTAAPYAFSNSSTLGLSAMIHDVCTHWTLESSNDHLSPSFRPVATFPCSSGASAHSYSALTTPTAPLNITVPSTTFQTLTTTTLSHDSPYNHTSTDQISSFSVNVTASFESERIRVTSEMSSLSWVWSSMTAHKYDEKSSTTSSSNPPSTSTTSASTASSSTTSASTTTTSLSGITLTSTTATSSNSHTTTIKQADTYTKGQIR
ncbi:hypothetical protein GLAREA_05777 [Glarea lozoyensis ATCC 20868]|uniref:Uncharacterized protein n=1 Tax=Glarea lozoyensis (strain ATCC 20868 / MF5171) TaxID=1116229 RepID=S3DH19_GLAL2|nr:uncharacterized protein GLAREA_05777 [Glarea lozoyensis ATCC 20868]EPE36439.1 hypothetical protein GLAREA_05777 [Glarea lozoyensis ATCC 20868]